MKVLIIDDNKDNIKEIIRHLNVIKNKYKLEIINVKESDNKFIINTLKKEYEKQNILSVLSD